MTTTTTPTRPPTAAPRPNLPKGLQWSNAWMVDGQLTRNPDPDVKMPVDERWEIAGQLWVCPTPDCPQAQWAFEPVADDEVPCCTKHPVRLVSTSINPADADPVNGARSRVTAWVSGVYQARKEKIVTAASARLAAAQQAVADATRTTAADMRGHVPSIAASGVVLAGGTFVTLAEPWWMSAVAGGAMSFGAVAAYLVAYWVRRIRRDARKDAKKARQDRKAAQHIAAGTLAAGLWLLASTAAGVLPLFGQALFTLMFGLLLTFAVNQAHWHELWQTRHRLKDMARRRAEAEARRAAEEAARAAAKAAEPVPTVAEIDESDPVVVGQRMAAEWARIARTQAAANAFPAMARTWLDPVRTQPVTAPINGELARIGWEYHGQSEPGALVARPGMTPPVTAARDWLAAVLFDGRHDPATVSLVDRPGGVANTFSLLITDSIPLGEPVRWQGKAGVKHLPNGTILTHRGRTIDGNDAYPPIYIPGQAFGGMDVGTRGGGKSAGVILYILNCLAAGIFPILFDPKQLVDLADFIGIFPIGVTLNHRDVITDFIIAERKRRERMMARRPTLDEFGRQVFGESRWNLADGPPITHIWEEFHDLAQDDEWVTKRLTNHIRFERGAAFGGKFVTQGGGLADWGNSVLRGLLNQTEQTNYRMDDHQARLSGRKDNGYSASDLPPLPGMCLVTAPETAPLPMRTAYVPRTVNHPESVFNVLYGRSSEKILQLPPPALPEETLAVMRRTGLMEIWERAQGDNGLDRLLAEAEDEEYGGPSPVPAGNLGPSGGQAMSTQDVVLAIAWKHPGLGPTAVGQHDLWALPTAGRQAPNLSNITRAAKTLDEKKGELTRDGGYRVTEKGAAKAKALYLALTGAAPAGEEPGAEVDE